MGLSTILLYSSTGPPQSVNMNWSESHKNSHLTGPIGLQATSDFYLSPLLLAAITDVLHL
jgi:hypothetical protein